MPLIGNDDLVRIELPTAGEWVEVKRRLSRGDEIAVQQAIVKGAEVHPGGEAASIDAANAIEAAEFATLDVAIRAWSFGVPVDPMHIRALDGESIDAIKVRLDELYPAGRSEEQRKNLSGSGAEPSGERATPLQSSAG